MELSKQIEITKKIYKTAEYLLLPLLLINLTVAENRWTVFGLRPEQFIYVVTIGLALYVGLLSRYRCLVTVMLGFTIVLRLLYTIGGGEALKDVGFAALAVIFAVAGAKIYGRNPSLLHKQLVIYLALCIPIMLLQILGVSSLLMGWNYVHGSDWSQGKIGAFKDIHVYDTLFVGIDNLNYYAGQGRPSGLFSSNNALSVFVSIAVGLNLAIARSTRLKLSNTVVLGAVVLCMSKLVFAVALLLYLTSLVFGVPEKRPMGLKLLALMAILVTLYKFFFPGLFSVNFSKKMILYSFLSRAEDIANALGFRNAFDFMYKATSWSGIVLPKYESYSTVSIILKSKMVTWLIALLLTISALYVYRLNQMRSLPVRIYVVVLLVCCLTQFAVPFFAATSFQLILGFALFPLFKRLWHPEVADMSILKTDLVSKDNI